METTPYHTNVQLLKEKPNLSNGRSIKMFKTYWYAGEIWEMKIIKENSQMKFEDDDHQVQISFENINTENQVSLNIINDSGIMNWTPYSGRYDARTDTQTTEYPQELNSVLDEDSIFVMFIDSDGLILAVVFTNPN